MGKQTGRVARYLVGVWLAVLLAGADCRPPQEPGRIVPDAPPVPPPMENVANAAENEGFLRVDRDFFENPDHPLRGEIRIEGAPEAVASQEPVTWKQFAPEQPIQAPPGEIPIADFRDFVGCAEIQSAPVAALCFRVMPDVSSLGLNEREVQTEGLKPWLAAALNISEDDLGLRFQKARKGPDWIEVDFSMNPAPNGSISERPLVSVRVAR